MLVGLPAAQPLARGRGSVGAWWVLCGNPAEPAPDGYEAPN